MSIRRYFVVGWMVVGLLRFAAAQDSSTPSTASPTQSVPEPSASSSGAAQGVANDGAGKEGSRVAPATALSAMAGMDGDGFVDDSSRDLPQIPSMLGGKGISLGFLGEMQRSNFLRVGVSVGAVYDDNPLLVSDGAVGNTSGSVFPDVRIEQTTSRARWSLGYAGGLTVNQRFTDRNQGSHDFSFDSQYRLSPHVNLRVAENFTLTTGFFDSGNSSDVVAGSGGPNTSLLTPLASQRASLTTVETNYHFALNDLVGVSGSFYDLHFTNPAEGVVLTDSQTVAASAFWLHKIFRGNWGGLSYGFQRITFNPDGDATVHNFMVVDTFRVANRFTVSAFAGPEYSDTRFTGGSLPTESTQWSVAAGVEAGWQNENTGFAAGYSRSISDGGGLLGAERLQNVHGSFRREFVKGWAVTLLGSHGTNTALVSSASVADSINLTTAGIGLDGKIGKSVGLRVKYTHDFQQQFLPGSLQSLDAHRNGIMATLSYQWSKPLGM